MYQKYDHFFQSVIRFLWDAHNTDEASTSEQVELGVSSAYEVRWEDVSDLWFLGVQVLCALMAQVKGFVGRYRLQHRLKLGHSVFN